MDRIYIGQVLNLYKHGTESTRLILAVSSMCVCLISICFYVTFLLQTLEFDDDDDEDENAPDFACTLWNNKYHLHTKHQELLSPNRSVSKTTTPSSYYFILNEYLFI